jgi:DNA-binding transcriptional LysR family regulator
MEWDDVRVLLAVLRAGNLQEAGAQLGVDRTTIGRRLAVLEASLGLRLFVRTRDGFRRTAAAERLRPHAERMEAEAVALAQVASSDQTRAEGVVKLATTDAFAQILVSEGLLAIREQHPDLVLELLAGNRPVDLLVGEADLALRVSAYRGAELKARCLARVATGLFASHEYVGRRGLVRSRKGLVGHDVLLPAGELARMPEARWLSERTGARVVFSSSSMPALIGAAAAGLGVVALKLGLAAREPRLLPMMVIEELPKQPLWLVSRSDGMSRAAVRVVADRISAICGALFSAGPVLGRRGRLG